MKELVLPDEIKKLISVENLKIVAPSYGKPRQNNHSKMAISFVTQLMNLFFDKLIDKLMDSNRVILPKRLSDDNQHELYITDVQQSHKNFLNSHTNGKVYNVVITGFNSPITIKLSGKRKQELKTRLENGQSFY